MKKDIVSARGILVTDNFISWVDKDEIRVKRAQESINHYERSEVDVREGLEEILERVSLSQTEVFNLLVEKTLVEIDEGLIKDEFIIKLPRILSFLNPVFSINEIDTDEAVRPSDNHLSGPSIKLKFDINEPKDGQFDLFLHSEYLTCKVLISKEDGIYSVTDVQFL